ncbi:MBL fold metallo-hydrolase [Bacillus cereus]|nr:MBL fold metallo-hydrolase [Bacillus cereus]MDA2053229.1 MBL fold metallo-hydrolase [Bacillus cereus]
MIQIKSLPAHDGDCFIISFGENDDRKNIIIDGGRRKPVLKRLKEEINLIEQKGQKIDLLVVTHIDEDHIQGILKLFEDVTVDKTSIKKVWFNSKENLTKFFDGIEKEDENLVIQDKSDGNISYKQGISFGKLIHDLKLSTYELILEGKQLQIGEAIIKVLSPNEEALKKLHLEWEKVFPSEATSGENVASNNQKDYEKSIEELTSYKYKEDKDVVNGSSIAFSIEYKDKKILMLADSFPSIVVENLNKFYPKKEERVFDLIKVAHHGSKYNTSEEFIEFVHCKNYLVSTNGKTHGFPKKETLSKIIVSSQQKCRCETNIYFNYPDVSSQIFSKEEMERYNFQCLYIGNNKEDILEV